MLEAEIILSFLTNYLIYFWLATLPYEVLTTQQNVSFVTCISSQQRDARVNASKMDTVSHVVEVRRRVIQYNGP